MPVRQVLILALSKMLSGVCTAGLTSDPDPVTGLRWVRPVREHDTLLPGDLTTSEGDLVQCGDVVELNLISHRPSPPHAEDWITDFIRCRPRRVRRLQGERRGRFLAEHLDRAPEDVLIHQTRSLCLVRPEQVQAIFSLDAYSGKYEARMSLVLDGDANHPRTASSRGVSVTDLKWRALGRLWLGAGQAGARGGRITLDHAGLCGRLHAEALYLTIGLSRNWQGQCWPLVVGVHVVPDYDAPVDVQSL